ncbi:hypothetical protein PoB_007059600, partial [Plakobranchus ocellatus]
PTQQYGWQRRRWDFDNPSFQQGKRTCGALRVGQEDPESSAEENIEADTGREDLASETQALTETAHSQQQYISRLIPNQHRPSDSPVRRRRSLPQAPGDPFAPLSHSLQDAPITGELTGTQAAFRLELEDGGTKQSPTLEAKIENFQQFLSNQGFQEKYVESIGEMPPTNDPQPSEGTVESFHPNKALLEATTASSSFTVDPSNLEDDDYHVVTKRSVTDPVTQRPFELPAETTWPTGQSSFITAAPLTLAPRFSQQNSVKGTSLPASTHPQGAATISPPAVTTTSVDDILNRLFQAALMKPATERHALASDQGSAPPEVASDSNRFLASILDLHHSSESQKSKSSDNNDYLKLLLEKSSVKITTPSGSVPPSVNSDIVGDKNENKMTSGVNKMPRDSPTNPSAPNPNNAKEINTNRENEFNFSLNDRIQEYDNQIVSRRNTTASPRGFRSMSQVTKSATASLQEKIRMSLTDNSSSSDPSKVGIDLSDFLLKEEKKSEEDSESSSRNLLSSEMESTPSATSTTDTPDDSREVTDSISSTESTTESPFSNDTERQSKEYTSREMAELYGSENKTNSLHKHSTADLDQKSNQDLGIDTSGVDVDSAEVFDTVSNFTDSLEIVSNEGNDTKSEDLAKLSLWSEHQTSSSEGSIAGGDSSTNSDVDSQDMKVDFLEQLSMSSTPLSRPVNQMELDDCDEEHPSVCVTEAIEELALVGHCERGWYGHRLLDRCYKPIGYRLTEFEARQRCLQHGAVLVMADTEFYGNVVALLLLYFKQGRQFDSKIWVDASLNMDVRVDGSCYTLQDGILKSDTCARRRSFFCQKDAQFHGFHPGPLHDGVTPDTYVHNMTSFHPQTLFCPLRVFAADDVVIWFKDGRPIEDSDKSEEESSFRFSNGQLSNSLELDLSILRRVGQGGDRIPKPAMLQGTYWCETWRRMPSLHRVTSHKIFLRFTDVITLQGYIITEPTSYLPAAMFNSMGLVSGLPLAMERRLATINKNITHQLRGVSSMVRDVITFVTRIRAQNGKSEFMTYICLATGDLSTHMRGVISDQYTASFRQILEQYETEVREEWKVTLPLEEAVVISTTDMCPESDLRDKRTGLSANFPTTPLNTRALSTDFCDGVYSGSAWCRGNLKTGAYWDNIRVTGSCDEWSQELSSSESDDSGSRWDSDESSTEIDDVFDKADGFILHKLPNSALLELDEIEIEEDNVADVTERLTNVLEDSDELSESDVAAVAQVVDRIVAVRRPPTEVSAKLVRTVSKVMDASPAVLKKAEEDSQALSR